MYHAMTPVVSLAATSTEKSERQCRQSKSKRVTDDKGSPESRVALVDKIEQRQKAKKESDASEMFAPPLLRHVAVARTTSGDVAEVSPALVDLVAGVRKSIEDQTKRQLDDLFAQKARRVREMEAELFTSRQNEEKQRKEIERLRSAMNATATERKGRESVALDRNVTSRLCRETGISVLKYGKSGKPKQRVLRVVDDGKTIVWGGRKGRRIRVSEIQSIQRTFVNRVEFFANKYNRRADISRCMTVVTRKRYLTVEVGTPVERDELVAGLSLLLRRVLKE